MTSEDEKDARVTRLIREMLARPRSVDAFRPRPPHRLYVWAPISDRPQIAAHLDWTPDGSMFTYTPEWIHTAGAYSLDPLNFPLCEEPFDIRENEGIPGVIADAGPDAFGRRVLSLTSPGSSGSSLKRILATSGRGVGAIRLTESHETCVPVVSSIEDDPLEVIEEGCRAISMGEERSDSLHALIRERCSGIGGARPKALVRFDGREVLVKFEHLGWDYWNMPVLEAACLNTARQAGIDAVKGAVISINNRSVLVVERFDRRDGKPIHYLSARSALNAFGDAESETLPPNGRATYAAIVSAARRMGIEDAGEAMFRRMVFNYAIGNTDDHLRNHGFLFDGAWRLAPAFDLVVLGGPAHEIGVGQDGLRRAMENLLSRLGDFGITKEVAIEIVDEVVDAARSLGPELDRLGMASKQRDQVLSRLCSEVKA